MCWLGAGDGGSRCGRFLLAVVGCGVGGRTGSGGAERNWFVLGVRGEERSGSRLCLERFVWGSGVAVEVVDDPGVWVEEGRCRLHKAVQ